MCHCDSRWAESQEGGLIKKSLRIYTAHWIPTERQELLTVVTSEHKSSYYKQKGVESHWFEQNLFTIQIASLVNLNNCLELAAQWQLEGRQSGLVLFHSRQYWQLTQNLAIEKSSTFSITPTARLDCVFLNGLPDISFSHWLIFFFLINLKFWEFS